MQLFHNFSFTYQKRKAALRHVRTCSLFWITMDPYRKCCNNGLSSAGLSVNHRLTHVRKTKTPAHLFRKCHQSYQIKIFFYTNTIHFVKRTYVNCKMLLLRSICQLFVHLCCVVITVMGKDALIKTAVSLVICLQSFFHMKATLL